MASQGQSSAANGPPGVPVIVTAPGAAVSKMPLSVAGTVSAPGTTLHQQIQQQTNNFDPLDKSSNTLKRNPKMELGKTDLLKLLAYLEGEVQARDIVIAALKSEKMKHLLNSKYRHGTTDPHSALARDVALLGGASGSQGHQIDQLTATLETLLARQTQMKSYMARVLKNAEIRHRMVIKELEEEKQKHEHDTAQGDDITYGLEKERTRLKKELEMEKLEKKRLEAEAKKIMDTLDEEKNRHRQIVLILLAERKKIIMKYIEERKRSEDLAQILSEEKVRTDTIAEGLEEESKKALHMEAEMEKQQAHFDIERSQFRQTTASKDKKLMEQQAELEKLRAELEALKDQQGRGNVRALGVTPPPPPAKPANLTCMPNLRGAASPGVKGAVLGAGTPMVSSKVVQPTATVSSVPVSGPTTGIARSVTPGQALRGAIFGASTTSLPDSSVIAPPTVEPTNVTAAQVQQTLQHKRTVVVPQPSVPSPSAATAIGKLSTRGVPPPVPPNKPVVPPKKEVTAAAAAAAFLRRSEQPSPSQSSALKQQNSITAQTPVALPLQQLIQPAVSAACNQPPDHEVKPR